MANYKLEIYREIDNVNIDLDNIPFSKGLRLIYSFDAEFDRIETERVLTEENGQGVRYTSKILTRKYYVYKAVLTDYATDALDILGKYSLNITFTEAGKNPVIIDDVRVSKEQADYGLKEIELQLLPQNGTQLFTSLI